MAAWFARFTRAIEHAAGSPWAFILSVVLVLVWAVTGPLFSFSDTWQITINTGTTIITFWLVFIIQATQTRDTAALHLKLDELIRVSTQARNELVDIEDASKEEIELKRAELRDLTQSPPK